MTNRQGAYAAWRQTLDKGVIHICEETEPGGLRFHHAAQNSVQFKMHELFISGISNLMYLDLS